MEAQPGDALAALANRVRETFEAIHRRVFVGDPASNPHLKVEVLGLAWAEDTPTLVLITPWTLNGLAFPPDGALPALLRLGDRDLPMLAHELPELGHYQSVNLVSNVACLDNPSLARELAQALAVPFREAVARARRPASVSDPSRRRLLRLS